jgi:hypothetical protein
MKNTDQKGFSVLDIILGIALVAVIGVAGYFAYQNAQNKTSSSATPKLSSSQSPTPTTSPTPSTGYLVIAQWGVKLPATGVLANLQYKFVDGEVGFSTPELYPKYTACGPGGLGVLSRVAVASDTGTVNAIKAGTFNGYSYYYVAAQQPCVQNASAPTDEKLEEDQHNALIQETRDLKLMAMQ